MGCCSSYDYERCSRIQGEDENCQRSAKGATHGEAGSRRGRNNAAMTIDAALFLLSLCFPLLASHWQGLAMAASPYAYASWASASLEFDGDAQC